MTTATKRTDIHRPSAISPADYHFVALGYQKCEGLEDVYSIQYNRQLLDNHRKATGAIWSQHHHAGNCHVCGAHCLYTAIFHHPETNTYIRTGLDCAEKMDMGDASLFRTFRKSIQDALSRRAGKAKAAAVLSEAALSRAWELYIADEDTLLSLGALVSTPWSGLADYRRADGLLTCLDCHGHKTADGLSCRTCDDAGTMEESKCVTNLQSKDYGILKDIIDRLVKYGSVSDAQMKFLVKLVDQIDNAKQRARELEERRAAEMADAEDCPEGRIIITGTVLALKTREGQYGREYKMLVKDDRGFKVWGSVPSSIRETDKGDEIQFTGTLTVSKDDSKFGFYKRPSKATITKSAKIAE